MKVKKKSLISLCMVFLILISLFPLCCLNVNAEYIKYQYDFITCGDYKYRIVNDLLGHKGVAIVSYIGNDEVVRIPASLDGYPVQRIDGYSWRISHSDEQKPYEDMDDWDNVFPNHVGAFQNNKTIKRVIIPRTVYLLGAKYDIESESLDFDYETFRGCSNLEEVVFLGEGVSGVGYIGSHVFYDCPKLRKIFIPESMLGMSESAFDPDITLEGYAGTRVETYASKYNYNFNLLERPICDLNDNRVDDIEDVTIIQKFIAKLINPQDLPLSKRILMFINDDHYVNIIDVTALQKKIAGLDYK